ncbi:MAG: hypothetical protein JW940_25545, partial [Polyangiaceae bacterium]|nr:hypothetical protein [Polyangiaceae bacterium]
RNLASTLVRKGRWGEATSVLQSALLSARTAGDAGRAKRIAEVWAKVQETNPASRANPGPYAQ